MEASNARKESPAMEMGTAARLAEASRQIGGLEAMARCWPFWHGFVQGPLSALAALGELQAKGMWLDVSRLLALGPNPEVSRPDLPLRWGVGFISALRKLEDWELAKPLTPSLVGGIHSAIDAPHLSRGIRSLGNGVLEESIGGTAVWTLAPRWQQSNRPPAWALGLASVSWEKEGPDTSRRSVAGHALLWALAPRLGIKAPAFAYLAPYLQKAASAQPGGLDGLLKSLRKDGTWRIYMEVFLAALTASAKATLELALATQQLHQENSDLVNTWVRAPRHPLTLLELLIRRPVLDLPLISQRLEVTQRTAGLLVDKLHELNLLTEITGQKRGRKYAYTPLLQLMQPGWGQAEGEADEEAESQE